MVRQFKLRLLLAILLATMVCILMRNAVSQEKTRIVLDFMLRDYGVEDRIIAWASQWSGYDFKRPVTAVSLKNSQLPCEFVALKQSYGWYWSNDTKKEIFFPGLLLTVQDNTPVRPIMDGKVVEISEGNDGRAVLIMHSQDFYSYYGGLKEVFVSKGNSITMNQVLGKSASQLYLELRGRNGPVDPQLMLE
ncbi:MAG: M23 family metallopeptidase [Syntrophomonadaceae bacterium]